VQQARPKIKPAPNVPIIFQMETVFGVEVNSQFTGVEYRYFVVFESAPSTLYLPPEGRDAIVRARPEIGDYIELVKQKTSRGFQYVASRCSDASEPQPERPYDRPVQQQQPPQPNGGMRMLAGNRHAIARPNGNGYNPETGGDYPYAQAVAHQTYAPNDRHPQAWTDMPDMFEQRPLQQPARRIAPPPQPPVQAQPPRPEASEVHPIGQQLAGCFRAAVDAWEETKRYAQEKYGVSIEYTSEDVRASGLSVYIGQQRGGK
jgi:hypothetical protein